jgi:hypothetical protein
LRCHEKLLELVEGERASPSNCEPILSLYLSLVRKKEEEKSEAILLSLREKQHPPLFSLSRDLPRRERQPRPAFVPLLSLESIHLKKRDSI